MTVRRKREAQTRRLAAEEFVGHLDENARAVAGVRFRAAGPTMQQVDEHLQRVAHDRVRALPFDVRDEADAARVVFESRVVQPDGIWNRMHRSLMRHIAS